MEKFDTLFPLMKEKKLAAWRWLAQTSRFNHPHRVETIAFDGGISYTIDQRDYDINEEALSASMFEFSIDASLHPAYTRLFLDYCPLVGVADLPNEGDFVFLHNPAYPWGVLDDASDYADSTVVGTCVRTEMSRATTDDPWGTVSSATNDISMRFSFFVGERGGDPVSNGRDDATPTELLTLISFSGTYSNLLPDFGDDPVSRFPWDEGWAAEEYSQTFDDHVSSQNATFGGGHSGSCSMRLVFTNLA